MKIGDRLAVQIHGIDVAEAVIEDIEDGNAVLVIPATRLVVQMKTDLDFGATKTPEVDREFAGLQSPESETTSEATEELKTQEVVQSTGEGIHGKELDSSAID